jgi:hypothetical protein
MWRQLIVRIRRQVAHFEQVCSYLTCDFLNRFSQFALAKGQSTGGFQYRNATVSG